VNIGKEVQTSKGRSIFISHYTNPRFPLSAPQKWWPTTCGCPVGFNIITRGNIKVFRLEGVLSPLEERVLEWKLRMKESFSSQSKYYCLVEQNEQHNTHLVIQIPLAVPVQEITKVSSALNSVALHIISEKRHWQVPALQVHKFVKTCSTLSARSFKTGKRITKIHLARAGKLEKTCSPSTKDQPSSKLSTEKEGKVQLEKVEQIFRTRA